MDEQTHIALVDDDAAVSDALRVYLSHQGLRVSCFETAESFFAADQGQQFECIVSDVRMPGMSGLDLIRHLKKRGSSRPVILITGHGDIDMAVSAIKIGAFDFIEKPFDEKRLLSAIQAAVDKGRQHDDEDEKLEALRSRFSSLSTRQSQVMELAATGLSNKEIAGQLNISPKTVENHRAWVMDRLGARNLAELVRMAMRLRR